MMIYDIEYIHLCLDKLWTMTLSVILGYCLYNMYSGYTAQKFSLRDTELLVPPLGRCVFTRYY